MSAEETELNPDWVSPPGHTIADILKENGYSLAEFASRMSMTQKEAARLLSGQLPLTLNIAGKLTLEFGGTVAFWQTREKHYREGLAKRRTP